jgi:hypothetical protein
MQRIVKVAFVTGCRSDESGSCGEGMIEAVLVSGWADHTNAKQQVSLMFESQSLQGIIDKMNRFDINPEPSFLLLPPSRRLGSSCLLIPNLPWRSDPPVWKRGFGRPSPCSWARRSVAVNPAYHTAWFPLVPDRNTSTAGFSRSVLPRTFRSRQKQVRTDSEAIVDQFHLNLLLLQQDNLGAGPIGRLLGQGLGAFDRESVLLECSFEFRGEE